MKKVLAVIAGVIAGGIVVYLIEFIGHTVYPLPADVDPTDMEQLAAYMPNMPLGALLFVVLGWIAGSFAGGFAARKVDKGPGNLHVLIVGGIFTIFGIVNFIYIPHPIWMIVLGLVIPIPLALYGGKVAAGKAE